MTRTEVAGGRLFIGACLLGALVAQFVVVPLMAADSARRYPEVAHLALPYTLTVGAALLGLEVALVAAWIVVSSAAREAPARDRVLRALLQDRSGPSLTGSAGPSPRA